MTKSVDLSEIELLLKQRKDEYELNNQNAEKTLKARKTSAVRGTRERSSPGKRVPGTDGPTGKFLYELKTLPVSGKGRRFWWVTGLGAVERLMKAHKIISTDDSPAYRKLVDAAHPGGFQRVYWAPAGKKDKLVVSISKQVAYLFTVKTHPDTRGVSITLTKDDEEKDDGKGRVYWDATSRAEVEILRDLERRGKSIVRQADTTRGGVEAVFCAIETMMSTVFNEDTKRAIIKRLVSGSYPTKRPGWLFPNESVETDALQLTVHGEEVQFGLRPEEW